MRKRWMLSFIMLCASCIFFNKAISATLTEESVEPLSIPAFGAENADWVFTGTVKNEHNETYSFLFHMVKQGHDFNGSAILVEDKTQTVIVSDTGHSTLESPEPMYAQAGHLFLRFDAITRTFMFGVAESGEKGFHFKADLLSVPRANLIKSQSLKQGVLLQMLQTGPITGHIQMEHIHEAQFVTARKSWLKQIWLDASDNQPHAFTSLMCHFRNDSGLYAIKLEEKDALQAAVAGFHDENDKALLISQFVNMQKQSTDAWSLRIMPDLVLSLHNIVDKDKLVMARVTNPLLPGFCVRLEDRLGHVV